MLNVGKPWRDRLGTNLEVNNIVDLIIADVQLLNWYSSNEALWWRSKVIASLERTDGILPHDVSNDNLAGKAASMVSKDVFGVGGE